MTVLHRLCILVALTPCSHLPMLLSSAYPAFKQQDLCAIGAIKPPPNLNTYSPHHGDAALTNAMHVVKAVQASAPHNSAQQRVMVKSLSAPHPINGEALLQSKWHAIQWWLLVM